MGLHAATLARMFNVSYAVALAALVAEDGNFYNAKIRLQNGTPQ